MNAASRLVEDLLARFQSDKTAIVEIYDTLPGANLYLLVHPEDVELGSARFLNYPAGDGVAEIPAFTSETVPLLTNLKASNECGVLCADGREVFRRMLDVVETGVLELAVNPGTNGIRVNRQMLLALDATERRRLKD